MGYKCIFFDLDGTLTDSGKGIFASFKYLFDHFEIDDDNLDYNQFVGPPLVETIGQYISKDKKIIEEAIRMYREHYIENGLLKGNKVYDGTEEMLAFLVERGYLLGVVTSKPEYGSKKVLEHFGLFKYFKGLFCPGNVEADTEKYEHLKEALNFFNCPSDQAVMVGDRRHDLIAAQKAGVDAIGVLYGYGSESELMKYPHIFLANSPTDIKKIYQCNN